MSNRTRLAAMGVALTVLLPLLSRITAQTPAQSQGQAYYPARDNWERRRPSDLGMNEARLDEAIAWARQQSAGGDLALQEASNGRLLGPLPKTRPGVNGIVIRRGYIVAEFGDTLQADPSYSVAKSYLATLLGLTLDRGLIKSVTDPVGNYVTDGGYDSPHNAKITWEHHVRQTSEWDGTLFDKPSTWVGAEAFGRSARPPRPLEEPGSYYEYNDVRINRFALSLLRVWKRPLPDVLKTEIMDPIGASDTWQYLGYDNSDVIVDGKTMKSVSGGTRWGGGLWMSTRDHARFGYLMLRGGNWNGRQIVPASWIKQETTPGGPIGMDYGYLWYTNTQATLPYVSRSGFMAEGDGPNLIMIDPERDLVVVWRWFAGGSVEFAKRIADSIEDGPVIPTADTTLDGLPILRPGVNGVKLPARRKAVTAVPPPGVPLRGNAVIAIFLAPLGKVDHVTLMRPVQPPQPALDQAALDAAMQGEWEPTFVNGVAHPMRIVLVVNFDRLAEMLEPRQQPPQQQR